MKFATFMMQTQPASLATIARKAEELGFESLWIPEHIILPRQYKSPYPYSSNGRMPAPADAPLHDPLLALAFVAGLTSKIKLATGIFVLPIRNPFATAKAVASLDVLSGGRFIFGVGIGWLEEEFNAVGMNFHDRALRTREYLELMKELWSSPEPVYKGKTVSIEGCGFMPKPVQRPHPPIVFGGHTPPALKRTARLGDGWYGIAESIDGIRETIGQLRAQEREFKRTAPLEITISPRIGQPLTPALVRQFEDMGVSRIIFAAGPSTKEQIAGMERFRDDVISKS
ncbi:MAG TPA: LLM class F420-dependent oxidoreductase [Candidatus Binataceae bacterium]|nr:LLM class F420-dependent oxidoreductase [Candidatus Binataceae bacterium]